MKPLPMLALDELSPDHLAKLKQKAAHGYQFLRFPRAASTVTSAVLDELLNAPPGFSPSGELGGTAVRRNKFTNLAACTFADLPFSWGPNHQAVLEFPPGIPPDHQDYPAALENARDILGFGTDFDDYLDRQPSWISTFNVRADQKPQYDPNKLTFQVVRNPYDWLISVYSYNFMGNWKANFGRWRNGVSFEDFVKYSLDPDMAYATWALKVDHPFPWPMMSRCFFQGFDNDDNCRVDVYIRYEHLQVALESLLSLTEEELNVDMLSYGYNVRSPKQTNSSPSKSYLDYRDKFYSESKERPGRATPYIGKQYKETIEVIEKAYAWDLENFNYGFEGCSDDRTLLFPELAR